MNTFDPERITYFAETDARGRDVPFGIRAKDRTRHVYVIGKSGMGKSTLLENMAVQDLKNGEGFAFIDPHGQSAEAIMRHIPEFRLDDVLYFNPSDIGNPIAFNVLEGVEPDKRFLVVSGLMSVFKKIWVDAWSARMEYLLQYTLLALLEYPGSTLLGVNRMLSEKAYRDTVVASVTDPGVKAFWEDEYAKYSEKYAQEAGDAIKNKIGQFTSNPIIRNIIGQPHTSFDIRKFMDQRRILIVNLSKGLIGESNANLLGSMLTTRIYLAAMSRADLPAREMAVAPNFYFYVDEFQSFANATFANILSEARKYKLNLTIAHQYVDQMEEDVRNAVFGNVGTTITFRVGPLDAEVLEKLFMPEFTATDIVNLGFAQIYLTLMIDGIGSPPFSAKTLPPIKEPPVTYYDVVLARSRTQFGTPRAEVEEKIGAFYAQEFVDRSPRKEKGGKFGAPMRSAEGARAVVSRSESGPHSSFVPTVPAAPVQHKDDLKALLQGISDRPAAVTQDGGRAQPPVSTEWEVTVRPPKASVEAAPAPVESVAETVPSTPRETISTAAPTTSVDAPVSTEDTKVVREPEHVRAPQPKELLVEDSVDAGWAPTIIVPREERESSSPSGRDRGERSRDRNAPRGGERRPREEREPRERAGGDVQGGQRHDLKEHGSRVRQGSRPERPSRPEYPPTSHELKNALAAALAGISVPASSPAPRAPETVVVSLEEKPRAPVPTSPPVSAPSSATEQNPVPHIDPAKMRAHLHERAEAIAHHTNAPHEITPKALAHMMRITLKDKKKRPTP